MAGKIGENLNSQKSGELGAHAPNSTASSGTHHQTRSIKFKWSTPLSPVSEENEKTGSLWDVVIIRAGKSDNGRFYPPNVLRESAHLFEGAPIYEYRWGETKDGDPRFVHVDKKARAMYPHGFVGNLVGELTNVRFDESEMALVGRAHIDDEDLRTRLKNRYERGSKNMPGLSIDAGGKELGPVIKKIRAVESVDIVTAPAAGGKMKRMVASKAVADMEDYAWDLRSKSARLADGDLSQDERVATFREMCTLMAKMDQMVSLEEKMNDTAKNDNPTPITEMDDKWKQIVFLADTALAADTGEEVMAVLEQIKATAELAMQGRMEGEEGDPESMEEGKGKSKTTEMTESTESAVADHPTTASSKTGSSVEDKPKTTEQVNEAAGETPQPEEEIVDKETAAKLEKENATLREELEAKEAALREQAFDHEFDKIATELKILDRDAAQRLLDPEGITYDDEGKVTGLREALEALIEARPWLKESKPKPPTPVGLTESREDGDVVTGLSSHAIKRRMGILARKASKGDPRAAVEYDRLKALLPA